jgi:hypothetical protein
MKSWILAGFTAITLWYAVIPNVGYNANKIYRAYQIDMMRYNRTKQGLHPAFLMMMYVTCPMIVLYVFLKYLEEE